VSWIKLAFADKNDDSQFIISAGSEALTKRLLYQKCVDLLVQYLPAACIPWLWLIVMFITEISNCTKTASSAGLCSGCVHTVDKKVTSIVYLFIGLLMISV